ncbi:MAG: family 20 glycosylhydrolase [Mycoplasmatales bacterium]
MKKIKNLIVSKYPKLTNLIINEKLSLYNKIVKNNNDVEIFYTDNNSYSFLLGEILSNVDEVNFEKNYETNFVDSAVMFDLSRNGVINLKSMQYMIDKAALLGNNIIYLYVEDILSLDDYKTYGYLKSGYSDDEIFNIINYAALYNIQIIPAIQTLAHLNNFLQWSASDVTREDEHCLLISDERNYVFIESVIKKCAYLFKTDKIHIGMDEADGVGIGTSYELFNKPDKFTMLCTHIDRVVDITNKYNLEPIMWSDMFFHLLAKDSTRRYWNSNVDFSKERLSKFKHNIGLMFWEYGSVDQPWYEEIFALHKKISSNIIFAGGMHTWNRFFANHTKALATSISAINAAKKCNVDQIVATSWGDNGQECTLNNTLYAMSIFGFLKYSNSIDNDYILQKMNAILQFDYKTFHNAIIDVDHLSGVNLKESNFTKAILYQDPIIGMFDQYLVDSIDLLKNRYNDKIITLKALEINDVIFDLNRIFIIDLLTLIVEKIDISIRLKQFYREKDYTNLNKLIDTDVVLQKKLVKKMAKSHLNMWNEFNKQIGFEYISIRYGGLVNRYDDLISLINSYINGDIAAIEMLEYEFVNALGYNDISDLNVTYHNCIAGGNFK